MNYLDLFLTAATALVVLISIILVIAASIDPPVTRPPADHGGSTERSDDCRPGCPNRIDGSSEHARQGSSEEAVQRAVLKAYEEFRIILTQDRQRNDQAYRVVFARLSEDIIDESNTEAASNFELVHYNAEDEKSYV